MIIKNSNLRRQIFSNRYKILGIIVAIILIFALIQLLNQTAQVKLNTEQDQRADLNRVIRRK